MALTRVSFDNEISCRPIINVEGGIKILKMGHPVIRKVKGNFVYNDLEMDKSGVMLLTGPNMGGKSTLLRTLSVCLILG